MRSVNWVAEAHCDDLSVMMSTVVMMSAVVMSTMVTVMPMMTMPTMMWVPPTLMVTTGRATKANTVISGVRAVKTRSTRRIIIATILT